MSPLLRRISFLKPSPPPVMMTCTCGIWVVTGNSLQMWIRFQELARSFQTILVKKIRLDITMIAGSLIGGRGGEWRRSTQRNPIVKGRNSTRIRLLDFCWLELVMLIYEGKQTTLLWTQKQQ
ncbi:uncharacterized protein LOC109822995 isoform X3 [Asparagus officinalis]|uniref:uncharacterized protein LOC109822995 isoform X3 n=1 Tax=Asparagus officinalis TaxID=4686 RepID=UPI00098E45EC|nr:uncharacterized protein LOC109822995 isoform X3 [Asparagus officinalis]